MNRPLVQLPIHAAFVLLTALPAQAQYDHTFVSISGSLLATDCAVLAQTCRSLKTAISNTNPGGTVYILDAGNRPPSGITDAAVTINQSITIVAALGATSVSSGDFATLQYVPGILIEAGPDAVVALRGVSVVKGELGDFAGIVVKSAGLVHLSDCFVRNMSGAAGIALDVQPTTDTRVVVSNCTFAGNSGGIRVAPDSGSAMVLLDDVTVDGNQAFGVQAIGNKAEVTFNETIVTGNGIGLDARNGARLISFRNNIVAGNGTDGRFTGAASLK